MSEKGFDKYLHGQRREKQCLKEREVLKKVFEYTRSPLIRVIFGKTIADKSALDVYGEILKQYGEIVDKHINNPGDFDTEFENILQDISAFVRQQEYIPEENMQEFLLLLKVSYQRVKHHLSQKTAQEEKTKASFTPLPLSQKKDNE